MDIKLKGLEFESFITSDEIQESIEQIAKQINIDYQGKEITFIGVLNGSFMFAADLLKKIEPSCEISFLKLSSYEGENSTGKVRELIGINEDLEGKHIIVAEDIVDSGVTLQNIIRQLKAFKPKSLKVASLLFKPEACKVDILIDYIGLEIPNEFIVGYGLDYDGYGRNLPDIYKKVN